MSDVAPDSSVASMQPTDKPAVRTGYIFWLYVLGSVLLFPLMFFFIHGMTKRYEIVAAIVIYSLVFGSSLFTAVLAALRGRTWLEGLLPAVAYSLTCFALCAFGDRSSVSWAQQVWESWPVIFLFPLVIFVGALPLYFCRAVLGWQLVRQSEKDSFPLRSWQMEDLFLITASVASILFLSRITFALWSLPANRALLPVFVAAASASVFCLVVVVPSVLVIKRVPSRLLSILGIIAVHAVVSLVAGTIGYLMAGYFDAFATLLCVCCPLVAGLHAWIGLKSLTGSGLVFISNRDRRPLHSEAAHGGADRPAASIPTEEQAQDDLAAHPLATSDSDIQPQRRRAFPLSDAMRSRLSAAVLVLLAIVSGAYSSLSANRKFVELERSLKLAPWVEEMTLNSDNVATRIRLKPGTVLSQIVDQLPLEELESLNLSHCVVDANSLLKLVPARKLMALTMNHTNLSDDMLGFLKPIKRFRLLGVGYTQISKKGLKSIASRALSVDASGLGLGDHDLDLFDADSMYSLFVADNNITNAGLRKLIKFQALNLSGNTITVSGLNDLKAQVLYLDRTSLDDTEFTKYLKKRSDLSVLSIRGTTLTDRILPALCGMTSMSQLILGEGKITQAGLAQSVFAGVRHLSLRGQDIDGECFRNATAACYSIDLRGTAVTPKKLEYLQNLAFYELDLSNTNIDDSALPLITKMLIHRLNVSGTKVTVAGLIKHKPATCAVLEVSLGNFTAKEIMELRRVYDQVGGGYSEE